MTSRRSRVLACLGEWSSLLVSAAGLALLALAPLEAGAISLRFYGNGVNDIDRIKIPIDSPSRPADVGATDFTIELWMKADPTANWASAQPGCPGADDYWIFGNILIDRDRFSRDRDYGISLLGRSIAFGVANAAGQQFTLCGNIDVVSDGQWHHIAVQRRISDGRLSIYVDGVLDVQSSAAEGPDGDISYPDGVGTSWPNSDPYIVIAAEKHDVDPSLYPSYSGWMDEIRFSTVERYAGAFFTPPSAPFVTDAQTAALYHLDENGGTVAIDGSGALGGPSNGEIRYGGMPVGPEWSSDTPFGALPPQPGSIQLASASYSVDESGGTVTVTVQRVGGSSGAATVDYSTGDDTAIAGSDYQATGGTLSWADGDATPRSITIPILDDADPEGTEAFRVTLSNVTGADPGTPLQASVSIVDDDDPGVVELGSSTYRVDEGSGTVSLQVTRRNGSAGAASVRVETRDGSALANADYQPVSQIVSWSAGESGARTVQIGILDDVVDEPLETFDVVLLDPAGVTLGSVSSAEVTVVDDDTPGIIQLASASYSVDEGDGTVIVTVQRVGGSAGTASVDYRTEQGTATAGADYQTSIGTLSWPDGDASDRSITISILDDSNPEAGESFRIVLSNVAGADLGIPLQADVSIVDNDTPGSVTFGSALYSTSEGSRIVSIEVLRLAGSAGAASVRVETRDGSALAGADYQSLSQIVTWVDGESGTKTVQVGIVDDSVSEPTESFELVLLDPTGVTLGGTRVTQITLLDDDGGSGGTASSSGGGGGGGLGWPLLAFLTLCLIPRHKWTSWVLCRVTLARPNSRPLLVS